MKELKTLKDLKLEYSGKDDLLFVEGQANAIKQ